MQYSPQNSANKELEEKNLKANKSKSTKYLWIFNGKYNSGPNSSTEELHNFPSFKGQWTVLTSKVIVTLEKNVPSDENF